MTTKTTTNRKAEPAKQPASGDAPAATKFKPAPQPTVGNTEPRPAASTVLPPAPTGLKASTPAAVTSNEKRKSNKRPVAGDAAQPGEEAKQAKGVAQLDVVELALDEIVIDAGMQCRAAMNDEVVDDYASMMREDVSFPPVAVFQIEGKNALVDGFHRVAAAKRSGRKSIASILRQGTRGDAIKFAITANTSHGLRFTNEDKRRAVNLAMKAFPESTDRELAKLCAVSQPFVSKLRKPVITVITPEPTEAGEQIKTPRKTVEKIADKEDAETSEDSTEQNHGNTAAKIDSGGAGADQPALPAPVVFDSKLVPLAELKKNADRLYNIVYHPGGHKEGLRIIGTLQRELDRWADWQAAQTTP